MGLAPSLQLHPHRGTRGHAVLGGIALAEVPLQGDVEVTAEYVPHRVFHVIGVDCVASGTGAIEDIADPELDGESLDVFGNACVPQHLGEATDR